MPTWRDFSLNATTTSGEFDAVVDLDQVLRDPDHPTRLLPAFDSGDHVHPNDAGSAAEANAMPLALFELHLRRGL